MTKTQTPTPETAGHAPTGGRKTKLLRLGLLAAFLVACYAIASATGILEEITTESIRETVAGAGWWGFVLFVGVYTFGILIQIPGLVFIAGAIVAYGQLWGGVLGLVGTVVALSASFLVVRGVGGRSLDVIPGKFMKRILARLESAPITTTILLRLLFWLAPPVTYALALSRIRYRDFILGSTIGLIPVIAVASIFFDYLFT